MHRQVLAHHYCAHLNGEVHQCVLYDGDGANARLVGVEYLISERLFLTLDAEELKYWHTHRYEVEVSHTASASFTRTLRLSLTRGLGGFPRAVCW